MVIASNLFVNFGSSAVEMIGTTGASDLPAGIGTITGNIFDLTSLAERPQRRWAVLTSASDVIISGNQIYVRGEADPNVIGIRLHEPALNLLVHDNLIRNCGQGIAVTRAASRVTEVVGDNAFVAAPGGGVPAERRQSHLYRGWNLVWTPGGNPAEVCVIDGFDPETRQFTLREPREMKAGDTFEVFPPHGANWTVHSNTLVGCKQPLVLDCYGSETSTIRGNTISRGLTTGVPQAVLVAGRFNLIGNHIVGFDEPDGAALLLQPDRLGTVPPNLYRDNVFERCTRVLTAGSEALWEGAMTAGNQYVACPAPPSPAAP